MSGRTARKYERLGSCPARCASARTTAHGPIRSARIGRGC